MSGSEHDDGFLTRWSRRKQAAKQDQKELAPAPQAREPVGEERADAPFDPDKLPIPLPDLEALKPGDSLVAFMQKGVPDVLRNAALRKMWVLDPMVRDFKSEALDYAWDWNKPGGVPGAGPLGVEDKVEEMVQALFRDGQKAPDEAGSDDEATEIPANEINEPPLAQEVVSFQIEQRPVSHSEKDENSVDVEATPRRRHGGAMPQV